MVELAALTPFLPVLAERSSERAARPRRGIRNTAVRRTTRALLDALEVARAGVRDLHRALRALERLSGHRFSPTTYEVLARVHAKGNRVAAALVAGDVQCSWIAPIRPSSSAACARPR